MRALSFLVVFALLGCGGGQAPPPTAGAGQNVEGSTTMVKGSVEIQRPGESEWKTLAPKDGLPAGSRVRSGADGEADLLLAEKSAVRLKPGTEIEISRNEMVDGAQKIEVKIDAGRLLHRFDRQNPNFEYRVKTPSAVAGIRGTQFELSAAPDQTRVRVLRGRVGVENSAGSVEVAEKQGTLIGAGQAPASPQELMQKEIDELMECSVLNFTVALEKTRRIATISEMRNIATPIELWMTQNGKYPESLQEAGLADQRDNWGKPYRYEKVGNDGYVIRSNGPDGIADTEDDLEYRK